MAENEILKDLFFIERGFLNGNHFVYRSDAPVLIDTGYISGFDETEKLITQLGVELSDISLIISTHTHCDHIGGNNRIQQKSGCDIALHTVGKYFIESRDDWSTWWRYYNQEAIGDDVLKKIIVYTLMMKKIMPADTLFGYLMDTYWFKETVDLYFKGRYEAKYDAVINSFLRRGIIQQENGDLSTTVKP